MISHETKKAESQIFFSGFSALLFRFDSYSLFSLPSLLRVVGGAGFADHVDLDLARVIQVVLDTLRDFSGHQNHIIVGYLLRNYHDTHLAARLDREGLVHSLEGVGDIF